MRTRTFLLVLGMFGAGLAPSLAAGICPSTDRDEDWPAACFVTSESGERRVRPEYIHNIKPNKQGVALIVIDRPRELVAVERSGRVRIPGIRHIGDFDLKEAPEGLGRYDAYVTGADGPLSKCGYFNSRTLRIAVPAAYDHCQHFKRGIATVCNDCVRYCTVSECQDSTYVGGQGIAIDRKGRVVRRFPMPALSEICHGRGTAHIGRTEGGSLFLKCE